MMGGSWNKLATYQGRGHDIQIIGLLRVGVVL